MAEFCECGSLVIDSRCSNKNCSLRATGNPASEKKISVRAKAAAKNADTGKTVPVKKPVSRRASKCITYNLKDLEKKESE